MIKNMTALNCNKSNNCPSCGNEMHISWDDNEIFQAECLCGFMTYMDSHGHDDGFIADPDVKLFALRGYTEECMSIFFVPNYMELDTAIEKQLKGIERSFSKAHSKYEGSVITPESQARIDAFMKSLVLYRGDIEEQLAVITDTYSYAVRGRGSECVELQYVDNIGLIEFKDHDLFIKYRDSYLQYKDAGQQPKFFYSMSENNQSQVNELTELLMSTKELGVILSRSQSPF